MKRLIITLAIAVLTALTVTAQEKVADLETKFDYIVVEVEINDTEAYLMVDTGAPMTLLDKDFVKNNGGKVDANKKISSKGFNGGETDIYNTKSIELDIGGNVTKRSKAQDLKTLKRMTGKDVVGILGIDILQNFDIDLKNKELLIANND